MDFRQFSETHLSDVQAVGDDKANLTWGDNAGLSDDQDGRAHGHQVAKELKADGEPTVCNDGGEVTHLEWHLKEYSLTEQ